MWMRSMILSGAAVLLFLLAGCGTSGEEGPHSMPDGQMIEVDLRVPEEADPGQSVLLEAKVTFEGENVEDADEVVFEIWKQGHREAGEKVEVGHQGEGIYSLEKTFEESGVYYVVSHVTLREMHNMPRKRIVVGDVPPEELEKEEPRKMMMDEGH